MSAMTKKQFKQLWESNEDGGGITFDEIAECAKAWGLFSTPRTSRIDVVTYKVLQAAGTNDCEEFAPSEFMS